VRILTAVAIVASFILIAVLTTIEGAFTILIGWIPFLGRVLPEAEPDGPSVLVGALALLLFTAVVHGFGRSRNRTAGRWRIRWTLALVLGVLLLFTAGISLVGITHQIAWLSTSEQPMLGEGLNRRDQYATTMIGMGLTSSYHDGKAAFPPGGTFSPDGEALHSWETHLLPYMWYSTNGIDMKRPWNSPENRKSFQCVLPEFINPAYRTPPLEDANGFGLSHYAANSRVLTANKALAREELTRGTSNTILVGEVNAGYKPWGHPVNGRDPTAGLNRGAATFGGPPNSGGVNFIMADGSVRFIANGVDPVVLRSLGDPRSKE